MISDRKQIFDTITTLTTDLTDNIYDRYGYTKAKSKLIAQKTILLFLQEADGLYDLIEECVLEEESK